MTSLKLMPVSDDVSGRNTLRSASSGIFGFNRAIAARSRPASTTSPKRIPLRRQLSRGHMRPVSDRLAQLLEPFEGRVFDGGFVEAHNNPQQLTPPPRQGTFADMADLA